MKLYCFIKKNILEIELFVAFLLSVMLSNEREREKIYLINETKEIM